jgi:ditrans,polycis-polyprenyl diphosphate synthase
MDGNRRYAERLGVDKIQGHSQGFDKLAQTLQWCHDLGITEVTVYAFSIENFKRGEKEVEALLNLAKEKFKVLISEEEKLKKHGVRVKIIGNISYLPEDMQDIIKKAEETTEKNSEATLNVTFSYTSREEITHAVIESCKMVEQGDIKPTEIDQELLESLMYTNHSSNPDLLIRTSGETRLSDFLLWQASSSITYFTPASKCQILNSGHKTGVK